MLSYPKESFSQTGSFIELCCCGKLNKAREASKRGAGINSEDQRSCRGGIAASKIAVEEILPSSENFGEASGGPTPETLREKRRRSSLLNLKARTPIPLNCCEVGQKAILRVSQRRGKSMKNMLNRSYHKIFLVPHHFFDKHCNKDSVWATQYTKMPPNGFSEDNQRSLRWAMFNHEDISPDSSSCLCNMMCGDTTNAEVRGLRCPLNKYEITDKMTMLQIMNHWKNDSVYAEVERIAATEDEGKKEEEFFLVPSETDSSGKELPFLAKFIKAAVKRGVDMNALNKYNRTLLMNLTRGISQYHVDAKSYLTVIKTLIGQGADVNLADGNRSTALHYLLFNKGHLDSDTCVEIVKLLIQAGADVTIASKGGITPLQIAMVSDFCDTETLLTLIDAGADLNFPDERGLTPLHGILLNAHQPTMKTRIGVVKVLIEAGANVNAAHQSGNAPLHFLSPPRMRLDLVLMRLSVKATPREKNKLPYDLAAANAYLTAAWVSDDIKDPDCAKECRLKSIPFYDRYLETAPLGYERDSIFVKKLMC